MSVALMEQFPSVYLSISSTDQIMVRVTYSHRFTVNPLTFWSGPLDIEDLDFLGEISQKLLLHSGVRADHNHIIRVFNGVSNTNTEAIIKYIKLLGTVPANDSFLTFPLFFWNNVTCQVTLFVLLILQSGPMREI